MRKNSLSKRMISIFLVTAFVLTGCGTSKTGTTNAAVEGDLELEANQSLLIGQVSTINGNEITLALAEEVDMSSMQGNRGNKGSSSSTSDPSATIDPNATQSPSQESGKGGFGGQRPDRGTSSDSQQGSTTNETAGTNTTDSSSAQMPSGDMPSGDMPGGDMPSGDKPSDDSSSQNTTGTDTSSDSSKQSRVMYTLTGEEKTMLIPVGTPVTTLLGTVSTFSRIAVENTVKVVVETNDAGEEVIVAVYIVG